MKFASFNPNQPRSIYFYSLAKMSVFKTVYPVATLYDSPNNESDLFQSKARQECHEYTGKGGTRSESESKDLV